MVNYWNKKSKILNLLKSTLYLFLIVMCFMLLLFGWGNCKNISFTRVLLYTGHYKL